MQFPILWCYLQAFIIATAIFLFMFTPILRYGTWFLLLFVLQIFIFNHIQFAGYATPLPYFYLVLQIPRGEPRWIGILLAFLLGMSIDIFSNTVGMAAAATCCVALCAPILLNIFISEDKLDEDFIPSAHSMGWLKFGNYVLLLAVLQCTLFFSIENFSFFNPLYLLFTIIGSSLITFLLVIGMEHLRRLA